MVRPISFVILPRVIFKRTKSNIQKNSPILIYLAKNISIENNDTINSIIRSYKYAVSKTKFLINLNNWAESSATRAVIIIDGINEGYIGKWKRAIPRLIEDIARYNRIGIILSCRFPYQKLVFKAKDKNKFITIYHPGFHGIEYDAQSRIFEYYKIHVPQVPLLTDEFSNPLFLISFCKTLNNATIKGRHKQINEIAAGQKGMTNIFEDFVKSRQKDISDRFNKEYGKNIFNMGSWLWAKGAKPGLMKEIAMVMAKELRDYVYENEIDNITKKYLCDKRLLFRIKRELVSQDLLWEDLIWENKRAVKIYRIIYQRFSDHLIVRTALENVDIKKKVDIKRIIKRWNQDNFHNLLEALMVELPNRLKDQEVFGYFKRVSITLLHAELFIESLYWRDNSAINKETIRFAKLCLKEDKLKDQILELLCTHAIKPQHKFNAFFLRSILLPMNNVRRDLFWSEFLRNRTKSSSIIRLVDWCIESDNYTAEPQFAKMHTLVLMWILTSTRRNLRDKATKAIVLIGKQHPQIVFDLTRKSLEANDTYIPERMLAASYGVAMNLHAGRKELLFRNKILPNFAKNLYKSMFAKKAPYSTTHELMRDFARRIIELALVYHPDLLGKRSVRRIRPPYRDGGIRRWGRNKDRDSGKYRDGNGPLQMDFKNYILGHLIPRRQNYDYSSGEYVKVFENIMWRLYKLGYSLESFGEVDKMIARNNSIPRSDDSYKTERYGKKYSWIAYFELYGYRMDKGCFKGSWRESEPRPAECKIDPSFPSLPIDASIINHDYLSNGISFKKWVLNSKPPGVKSLLIRRNLQNDFGPWILLSGVVTQENVDIHRECNIFIYSRFLYKKALKDFRELEGKAKLDSVEYSEAPEEYRSFAGEIPWSETWPENGLGHLSFKPKEQQIIKKEKEPKLLRGDRELSAQEELHVITEIIKLNEDGSSDAEIIKHLSEKGIRIEYNIRDVIDTIETTLELQCLNPIRKFAWEMNQSSMNPGMTVDVPAKEILMRLGLSNKSLDWVFFDKNDKIGAIIIHHGDIYKSHQSFTYIRKDLLDKYLNSRKMTLVWFINGERRYKFTDKELYSNRFKLDHKSHNPFEDIKYYADIT